MGTTRTAVATAPDHYWTRKARGKTVGLKLTEDELGLYREWIENNRERGWAGRVCVLGGISGCCSSATSLGLSSERGIAWRVADSLSLRAFLALDVTEFAPPNHSSPVAHAASDRRGNARGGGAPGKLAKDGR